MIVFILLAALLTLTVLSLFIRVARSKVLHRTTLPTGTAELDIVNAELELLRIQRQELEQDVATGRVAAQDHEQTLVELAERADSLLQQRQKLQPAGSVAIAASATPKSWPLVLAGLAIPVLTIGLYLKLGTPAAIDQSRISQTKNDRKAATVEVDGKQITIAELVARLEQKLNEQPDQAEGWILLGHTKYKLGDFAGAAAALRKALSLSEQHDDLKALQPDLQADLADALVMQQGGNFSGEPEQLVMQALQLNPAHQKALALAAGAAMRANQRDAARGYWLRLRDTLPANAPGRSELNGVIAELGGEPNEAGNKAPVKANRSSSIAGKVVLTPELSNKMQAGDTLFVFARRPLQAGSNGPRMPLAVARFQLKTAGDLPRDFELTDAMAMAAGGRLSDADEVEVTARISHSGNAIPATGDLTSTPLIVKTQSAQDSRNLKLVIDRAVP